MHLRAFCPKEVMQWGRGNALPWVFVLPSYGVSYQGLAVGFMSCDSLALYFTKALRWGLGNALPGVFVLSRPCGALVMCRNGCLSHQGLEVGHKQYIALDVCPTKALRWGIGSVLQWVFALPRPCHEAYTMRGTGCLSYQGLVVARAYAMHFSGFLSFQSCAVWPSECVVVGACPPKALPLGVGNALHKVLLLLGPCVRG